MTSTRKTRLKLFWISFARPGENYVVLEEAVDVNNAIGQAIPLKSFSPRGWSMEAYEIPTDDEEAKDFEKHKLITEADLRAKGYLKASDRRRIQQSN